MCVSKGRVCLSWPPHLLRSKAAVPTASLCRVPAGVPVRQVQHLSVLLRVSSQVSRVFFWRLLTAALQQQLTVTRVPPGVDQ
jgi:hypothetical protein